ncbi:MAG: phytoene desaturase family protein, partial [Solirubrobacteraceae bacterium]
RDLDLDLDWIDPPVAMAHVLAEGGEAIALHRDLAATARSLDACTPGAGAAWRDLIQTLWPHREALVRAGLGRLPPVRPLASLLAGLRLKTVKLAPLALAPSAVVGRRLLRDDRAAAWLAGSGAHADLSPRSAGSGAIALALNFLAHVVGWPFPRGGAGRLTDALVARLQACGGQLRCAAAAEQIELRGGRVAAVRLRGGERVPAAAVICTASPAPLLSLLRRGALPGRLERRLRSWRYGLGTLKLDYALSGPVAWRSDVARQAGVVHVGGALGEIIRSLEQAGGARFPDRPTLVVGQQSLHDPSRAPAGRQALYVYARVPQEPELEEAEMGARVERQIERFAPGFGELVLARSIRGPKAIEAENPSMRGGDLASGSCKLDQQVVLRPALELCRGRTPLRGLYVAGAWVHPGPGVHGVSGAAAASAVLADEARRGAVRRPTAQARAAGPS